METFLLNCGGWNIFAEYSTIRGWNLLLGGSGGIIPPMKQTLKSAAAQAAAATCATCEPATA
ncbi:MAG TPA: hypothetical protein DCY14_00305 [Anaerolineae bacterium]|nr:hypothetical protein [Anaerolineae bacterium]